MAPFLFYNNFYTYLHSEKRFSEHTIIAYVKDVEQFFDFSSVTTLDELKEVHSRLVRGWVVHLIEGGMTNKSVNRKLASLRTYFRVLIKEGYLESNPAKAVQGPKIEKRLPSFVDEIKEGSEIQLADWNERDMLMVELLYQTGMRLSELVGLTLSDLQNGSLRIIGKGNKERIVPISAPLIEAIHIYRANLAVEFRQNPSLLLTDSGKKLYSKFVYRKINYYLSNVANVQKRSPHVLRHTFATHMLNNGAGLEVIKELLGHANLSATQVYTHNSFAKLNSIYSQAHPRGHKKEE